ncbi:MAG: hypothetical protein AAF824_22785 [Bacteroidota bacterium]
MENKERALITIIKSLAKKMDLEISLFCYKWVIQIRKYRTTRHIIGYDWELNTSTAQLIAKDKYACYELLKKANLPTIEHKLFLNTQSQHYIGGNGSWHELVTFYKSNNFDIVCKPNVGTGGNSVFRVQNQLELESACHHLFSKSRGLTVSPYYDIRFEYRVIVLQGEALLVYSKEKPSISGDGKRALLELLLEFSEQKKISLQSLDISKLNLDSIPDKNEVVHVGWQHNLGKGANASLVNEEKKYNEISKLGIDAASAINASFVSVDIVETVNGLFVLEINSGIMMEYFSSISHQHFNITTNIYRKALTKMFES